MKPIMTPYQKERDFGEVYRLFTDIELSRLIIDHPIHRDTDSFEKWFGTMLGSRINDFFVFWKGKAFVGFAYSYDFKIIDGHTAFTVAVTGDYQNTGTGILVSAHFLNFLFEQYPLRKIYMRVYSYNRRCIDILQRLGIEEEGILKDYRYYRGCYHDLVIFSMSREKFLNKSIKFLKGESVYEKDRNIQKI